VEDRADVEPSGYDVVILGLVGAEADDESPKVKWTILGGDLAEAREVVRKARAERKVALVVPTRYRQAKLSKATAREIARASLSSLAEDEKADLSALSDGEDEGAFWHFSVEEFAAQARGLSPGTRRLLVDKLDGHLWTHEEATSFWRLSALP
jgi:hypothetical protein